MSESCHCRVIVASQNPEGSLYCEVITTFCPSSLATPHMWTQKVTKAKQSIWEVFIPGHSWQCTRTSKKTGRFEISSYMITTGGVSWSERNGSTSTISKHKEEIILPPIRLDRITAGYLISGLIWSFQHVCPIQELMEVVSNNFRVVQVLFVADSASANWKALPLFCAWLAKFGAISTFTPCLLHQMARCIVLNLERENMKSSSAPFEPGKVLFFGFSGSPKFVLCFPLFRF